MRTDSVGLSKDAQAAIVAYVEATYGSELARARQFKTRAANAQEAHEAIRPTRPEVTAEALDAALGSDHRRLYDLIRRRAIASQMTAAEYEEARLVFVAEAAPAYEFVAKQSSLIEPGYLLVYSPELAKEARAKSAGDVAKPVSARATSFQAVGNVTQPPAQYNEPGLVKALEKNGIGRPSTYASIIDKLFQKGYVVKGAAPVTTLEVPTWRVDAGGDVEEGEPVRVSVGSKEADRMQPTALGTEVTTCLADIAPMILDVDFTSRMEADLDCISKGEKKKVDVLTEFYGPFREAWGCATGLRPRAALPSAGDAK
jgi:DNA topoisomerase-1